MARLNQFVKVPLNDFLACPRWRGPMRMIAMIENNTSHCGSTEVRVLRYP